MTHQGTKTIETERLILRKFTQADIKPAFQNWCSDGQVTKFLTWPTHKDITVTEMVINDWIKRYILNTFYRSRLISEICIERHDTFCCGRFTLGSRESRIAGIKALYILLLS